MATLGRNSDVWNGERKRVTVTAFKKGGEASVASHIEGEFTKKEVLKKVSEWWDSHGTGFNDYDGIQITVRKENHGKASKGD